MMELIGNNKEILFAGGIATYYTIKKFSINTYDRNNRVISSNTIRQITNYKYDNLNRVITETKINKYDNKIKSIKNMEYDNLNRVITKTERNNFDENIMSKCFYEYDSLGEKNKTSLILYIDSIEAYKIIANHSKKEIIFSPFEIKRIDIVIAVKLLSLLGYNVKHV